MNINVVIFVEEIYKFKLMMCKEKNVSCKNSKYAYWIGTVRSLFTLEQKERNQILFNIFLDQVNTNHNINS